MKWVLWTQPRVSSAPTFIYSCHQQLMMQQLLLHPLPPFKFGLLEYGLGGIGTGMLFSCLDSLLKTQKCNFNSERNLGSLSRLLQSPEIWYCSVSNVRIVRLDSKMAREYLSSALFSIMVPANDCSLIVELSSI